MPRPRIRFSQLALGVTAALGALALARRRRISLRGRTVLVTGGSRGLGIVLARELAAEGARLALCARDAGELETARRDLERRGAEVMARQCDVTRPEEVERLVEAVEERYGALDVLVNVAGMIQVAPAETLSLADLQEAVAANFWGVVHACLAALPGMRARRFGRIVNVTSIGGTVAVPHLLGYTSGKFAAVGFSTGLAAEAARDGVVVTTVVPGLMRTGSFLHALVKGTRAREASLFSLAASLPLLTMPAGRAARRIVRACARGERFVTLGLPAKVLRLGAALAPGLTGAAFAVVARLLPGPGGDQPGSRAEPASAYHRQPAVATFLGDRAARDNNEQPSTPTRSRSRGRALRGT